MLQIQSPQKQLAQTAALRAGDLCPLCATAWLDYDGLLNLVCPQCGFSAGGGCHT